jgi:hypothetical protein
MINIKIDFSDLKWEDLVSPTMKPDDYLKEYEEKIALYYKAYEPKLDILDQITKLLNEKKETLKTVALGADWCPDCTRNVPRMIKIMKLMKNRDENFKILYSPPFEVKTHFNLKRLPTFYFFNGSGDLLGIIVENPKNSSTLEEDLLEILEDKL